MIATPTGTGWVDPAGQQAPEYLLQGALWVGPPFKSPTRGDFRLLYLQHASDAVVFFDPTATWRRPDRMTPPRGPDVAPGFWWLPVVTVLRLSVDIMTATKPPQGHGHSYDFVSYAPALAMLLDLPDWTEDRIDALARTRQD